MTVEWTKRKRRKAERQRDKRQEKTFTLSMVIIDDLTDGIRHQLFVTAKQEDWKRK